MLSSVGAVDCFGTVAGAADGRIRLADRHLDVLHRLIRLQNPVRDEVGEPLDQVEIILRNDFLDESVYPLIIHGVAQIVRLRRLLKIEVHGDIYLIPPANAMLFLHDTVVGIENGVYETNSVHGGQEMEGAVIDQSSDRRIESSSTRQITHMGGVLAKPPPSCRLWAAGKTLPQEFIFDFGRVQQVVQNPSTRHI